MIQSSTDSYIKICMKTWLLCESCIHAESNMPDPRYELISECSECAKSCFAVVSRLVSQADELGDLAINCVLHCRQCANECQKYDNETDLLICADVCSICAELIKKLATFSLN
jgi:hypothetical protein